MAQATQHQHQHDHQLQDAAIHLIASAARILLMLGTAILVGEVAAGPARKLLEARRERQLVNEDGEPAD